MGVIINSCKRAIANDNNDEENSENSENEEK